MSEADTKQERDGFPTSLFEMTPSITRSAFPLMTAYKRKDLPPDVAERSDNVDRARPWFLRVWGDSPKPGIVEVVAFQGATFDFYPLEMDKLLLTRLYVLD